MDITQNLISGNRVYIMWREKVANRHRESMSRN